ncbi:MAG TPA: hypothetical protein VFP84_00145 [Kofleriaceae bacterium]|nr:hypothetical protein [Kofleriaceae bacterium]
MESAVGASRGFRRAYQAGTRDREGQFMGGTEIMQLVPHLGKLYAVTSTMWDRPGDDPAVGAQVLALDHPDHGWRVEHAIDARTQRMSLASVAFTVDRHGHALAAPTHVLLAGPSNGQGAIAVSQRDEGSGAWVRQLLGSAPRYTSVRCLYGHRDAVTGVDHVLAGTSPNGIYRGAYDAAGHIVWQAEPELAGYEHRPMAFAVCNGVLHAAIKPHVYRRIDGPAPRWEAVYTLPDGVSRISSGLRGLTAVPHPSGDGECLLAALEGEEARIVRLDPRDGYRATVELDVLDFLAQGDERPGYAIVAYNDMTPLATGALLLGLSVTTSRGPHTTHPKDGWRPDARYLVRDPDRQYHVRSIVDPDATRLASTRLVSTRTIEVSPFDRETLYFGGYDPHSTPSHNTAWVYAAPLAAAL